MAKIIKYPLEITDEQEIELPHDPHPLAVGEQDDGRLALWVLVAEGVFTRKYRVFVVGTGSQVPEDARLFGRYVGTQQMPDGHVWHVFLAAPKK